jgi:hypothetical protein
MIQFHNKGLVILGAPRSGTTLVASAIAAHPDVALLFEEFHGGMFRIMGGKLPAVKLCTPNEVDLDRRWHGAYAPIDRNGWLRKRIGYRLPRSRLSLRDMAARLELKAICLLRDPANNLAALKKRENRSDAVARDILRRTYDLYRRLPGERGIDSRIVSFDRLLRAPEAQIRLLCDWLGLRYDTVMLDAPRLNPLYPEAEFRVDKAASAEPADERLRDSVPATLRADYDSLLARAL